MNKSECEIRFLIQDVKKFEEHLKSIDHVIEKEYSFIDHFFKPKSFTSEWKNFQKTMRVRAWEIPKNTSEILFSKVKYEEKDNLSFKRAFFPQGKVKLYSGNLDFAFKLLKELEYDFWFKIEKKKGKVIDVKSENFSFVLEEIKGLGFSIEIEVFDDDPQRIRKKFTKIINVLNLKTESALFYPLPKIYFETVKIE
ncbi:MAG: CYTH domain-containing protein [Candidatus Helarchaeota archaeon]